MMGLQPGIAVGIDQGVQASALLAVGAVLVVVAGVVGQVIHIINRGDLVTADLIGHGIQGCHADDLAAVVTDGLDALLGGEAGGAGCHQHQHVLVADHGLDVVPEEHLVVDAEFRLHHIDRLVGVDALEAALGQLVGKAGADDGGAVQTEDGIDHGAVGQGLDQLLGNSLGFAETGLGVGNINIIIDMGVVGGEMPPGDTQGNVATSYRQVHQVDHTSILHTHKIKKAFFHLLRHSVFAGGD